VGVIQAGAMTMGKMRTPKSRMRIAAICQIMMTLAGATAAHAQAQGPCQQIAAACRDAGFVQGGARTGEGIAVDCIRPIMLGTAQPRRATKPLPQVDPQIVAACKVRNPDFGQGGRGRTPADAAPPSPPPPAATEPSPLPVPPPQAREGNSINSSTLAGEGRSNSPPPLSGEGREGAPALPAGARRPNIVFVLTDDLSTNLVQYMPNVGKMQQDGVTFANYFVTDSLCCPSRSSIFTGRYPHNTGIYRNVGADGGYQAFVNRGHERTTFAAALTAAGYHTAMLGKYLNGYQPRRDPQAPGWSVWDVAGNGYRGFDYDLNHNGRIDHYASRQQDYMTDVLSAAAVNFIKQQTPDTPFMIEIATFAPHFPYTPAPRDADAFPRLRAPRTAAFNAAPDAAAPKWLAGRPALSEIDAAMIDNDFRKRAQSVLAVDAMIGELQEAVAAIGAADNTYFVFSSDNGYHMGEYRLMPGKMTAFDTDIHVPLVVTGPGVPAGRTVDEMVQNIDLCPTFTELGFAPTPASVDGRSLAPLLRGETVEGWRTVALVEHRGPIRNLADPDLPDLRYAPRIAEAVRRAGNPTTYEAIRTAASLYVEYADGEKEYHDLAADPNELRNTYAALSDDRKAALHATLDAVQTCRGAASCQAAEHV
jgi:N-acetylglucosamine-6-sulfatase